MVDQIREDDIMIYDSPGIRKYNNLVAIMQEAMKPGESRQCQFYDECSRTDEKLKDREGYVPATGEQCYRNGEGCEQLPTMLNAKEFNY